MKKVCWHSALCCLVANRPPADPFWPKKLRPSRAHNDRCPEGTGRTGAENRRRLLDSGCQKSGEKVSAAVPTAAGFCLVSARNMRRTTGRGGAAIGQLAAYFLQMLLLPANGAFGKWLSLQAVQSRLPGCCPLAESFDCGDGKCISLSCFHDGAVDCADGSDEFCFPGQIACGSFCADPVHLEECVRNPNCTVQPDPSPPPPVFCPLLKRRLCGVRNTISCRGYGECIFVKWLMDGKRDCLDGSDEDAAYANLFKIAPVQSVASFLHSTSAIPFSRSLPTTVPALPPPIVPIQPEFSTLPSTRTTEAKMMTPWEPDERKTTTAFSGARAIWWGGVLRTPTTRRPQQTRLGSLIVESTEPGPWQRPQLDDFGVEFARALLTPSASPESSSAAAPSTSTSRLRTLAEGAKAVDKWLVFPNWPTSTTQSARIGEGAAGIAAPADEIFHPIVGEEANTPKYPFDRGEKVELREDEMALLRHLWAPVPFVRPEKTAAPTTRGTTTSTVSSEIWEPEGRIGGKAEDLEEEGEEGTTRRGEGEETTESEGKTEVIEEGTTAETQTEMGTTTTATGPEMATKGGAEGTTQGGDAEADLVPVVEVPTTTSGPSTALAATQESTESPPSAYPPTWTPPFSTESVSTTESSSPSGVGGVPLPSSSPLPTAWAAPVSRDSVSSLSASLGRLNCTERMNRMAGELVPNERCVCPAGQMQNGTGDCTLAPISTFRARLNSICGTPNSDPSTLDEKLIVLKSVASLGRPVCVRGVVDGVIVLNTVCESDCHIDELASVAKSRDTLPELDLRISELSDGACHQFDLNDCDERAECLVEGLRFRCRCLPGTEDTSPEGSGIRCRGTVISQTCTKFLGVCVLVWVLMLLLLCFLLPVLFALCLKYCCDATTFWGIRLRNCWDQLLAKLKGKDQSALPTITTSHFPPGQRRESKPVPTTPTAEFPASTLKVPSPTDGLRSSYPQDHPLAQHTDSEDYLIMEEEEAGVEEDRERETARDTVADKEIGEAEEESKGTVTRQQTEQSSSAATTGGVPPQKSMQSEDTTKSQWSQGQVAVEVHEEDKQESAERREEEERKMIKKKREGAGQEAEERPRSAGSRVGTPTIWDQYRILGDQYTKYGTVEGRRESSSSLEELISKRETLREEKRSGERAREQELIKDDLDAELKMRSEEKQADQEGEKVQVETAVGSGERRFGMTGEPEPGRSMPTPGPGILPPGALNICFATDDMDIPQRPQPAPALPAPPPQHERTFRPRDLYGKRTTEKPPQVPRTPSISGSTVVKGPTIGRRKVAPKGDFVLVKGKRVDNREDEDRQKRVEERRIRWRKEEEERRQKARAERERTKSNAGQVRREEGFLEAGEERRRRKAEGERAEETSRAKRQQRMRAMRAQRAIDDTVNSTDRRARAVKDLPSKRLAPPQFDPDLPSTSQAAPFWQKSLRPKFVPRFAEETATFREEGRPLDAIEKEIEEKVHSGCITDREPWDISISPEPLPWPPRREASDLSEGQLAKSLERLEHKVHEGCITHRKPWDSSPYREGQMRRGLSAEWDFRGKGEVSQLVDVERVVAGRGGPRLEHGNECEKSGPPGRRRAGGRGVSAERGQAAEAHAESWLDYD